MRPQEKPQHFYSEWRRKEMKNKDKKHVEKQHTKELFSFDSHYSGKISTKMGNEKF